MSTVTQIKRLRQGTTDFVPITMSEAVVVNTQYLDVPDWNDGKEGNWGSKITTLDKVLAQYGQFSADIKEQILSKQDQLTWADYFTIDKNTKKVEINWGKGFSVSNGTVDLSFSIYEIKSTLPTASADCLNKIYIIPLDADAATEIQNYYAEYVCMYDDADKTYSWEKLGTFKADTTIDLSDYLTIDEFETYKEQQSQIITTIQTNITDLDTRLGAVEDITEGSLSAVNLTQNGQNIVVNYGQSLEDICNTVYQDVSDSDDYLENNN